MNVFVCGLSLIWMLVCRFSDPKSMPFWAAFGGGIGWKKVRKQNAAFGHNKFATCAFCLLSDPPECVPSVIAKDVRIGAELGFHFPHDQSYVGIGSRVCEVFHWQMPIAERRCNAISIWMESEMVPMAWACFVASMGGISLAIDACSAVGRFWANQWSHHCQTKILCKDNPIIHYICQPQLPMRRGMSPLKPSIWLIVGVWVSSIVFGCRYPIFTVVTLRIPCGYL